MGVWGWPGNYSYNIATTWTHLASWDLPDFELSWNSKIGPSVAILTLNFHLLHFVNHLILHLFIRREEAVRSLKSVHKCVLARHCFWKYCWAYGNVVWFLLIRCLSVYLFVSGLGFVWMFCFWRSCHENDLLYSFLNESFRVYNDWLVANYLDTIILTQGLPLWYLAMISTVIITGSQCKYRGAKC